MLDDLIRFHKEIEGVIARQIAEISSGTCKKCQVPCCREDICGEVDESYFLSRIIDKKCRKKENKWLAGQGCILEYGRPLLCRAYFCDELLALAAEEILLVKQCINDWKLVYKNFANGRSLLTVGPETMNTARLEKTLMKSEKFRQKWLTPVSRSC